MVTKRSIEKPRIMLVPYPAQGHVTPMLKLASVFHSHGLQSVLVIPDYIHRQISGQVESRENIICMSISDGLEEDKPRDFFALERAMEENVPIQLEQIVGELNKDGGLMFMVVDLLASWAVEVGKRCRIPVAGFWPAMFATYRLFASIPEMAREGLISDTGFPERQGTVRFLPDLPMLSTEELPWLIGTDSAKKARFKFWDRTFTRCRALQWLLVNSFPEDCVCDGQQLGLVQSSQGLEYPSVFHVGPLSKHALTKNPSFWEEDMSCLEWLDKQKPGSVVYISFGSWVSPIGEGKVRRLAMTLEALRKPFIWALKYGWRGGLPSGYLDRISSHGKVATWAPQMEVLQHKAVGCYLTHCGWNSTMEAIQCQKPLLCYPAAGDQFLNCAYIVDVWRIGMRLDGFGQKDVEDGLRMIMEDSDMGSRLTKIYQRTMGEDSSSRLMTNLTAFIDDLERNTGMCRLRSVS